MYHDGDMFRRRDDEEELFGVSDESLSEVLDEDEEEEEEKGVGEIAEFGNDGDLEGKWE